MSRPRNNQVTNRRLPPLISSNSHKAKTNGVSSPCPRHGNSLYVPSPAPSRYHNNCCSPNRSYSPTTYGQDSVVKIKGFKGNDMNRKLMSDFLQQNPEFIEEFVMQNVDLELLERWIIRKTQRNKRSHSADITNGRGPRKTSLSRWKFCVHADKRKMLQDLTNNLYLRPSKAHVLWELADTVASAVNADSWNLYVIDKNTQELCTFTYEDSDSSSQEQSETLIPPSNSIAGHVAKVKETVRWRSGAADPRFPEGISMNKEDISYVLCHPIVQPDGNLSGVLELYRKPENNEFHEEDEEIVNSYLVWGGIALHYAELYISMAKQRKLNNFLLTVVKSIFQDMISMDNVILKIMTFAQKLVNADRASLFLVDSKTKELYARIFDAGPDGEMVINPEVSKEIRFDIGKGIAGHVALTGESLNIADAYSDERFNRQIDIQTGYRTRSLLCMPIFTRGHVIGVVQMVNKLSGIFNKSDEESFATFAIYCGLALHHAKLYDKIRKSEQKYKVAMEILAYHNTCKEEEVEMIKNAKPLPNIESLKEFTFSPFSISDSDKVSASMYMFTDLFGLQRFDYDSLTRFTITVRKNYRRVPYHNWTHGFSVANAIYAIIKNSPGVFRPLEELSLYVACLCHDLDHRGKNNQFLVNSASPLAAIYSTSTMEHHHFNQTVSILQQSGHNIFKNLSSNEYKQVLGNIKHCILATDLALFFPNKAKLKKLIEEDQFDWNNSEHRLMVQAICMTGCDLCASSKPWEEQKKTVRVIFEEFYDQGDAEKAQGRNPIPMMDRTKAHEQPASQVGFLNGICIPCYDLLHTLIPSSRSMLDGCLKNLERWQVLADEQKKLQQNIDSK